VWLLRKEWRELWVSRAWWVMLALMGPLVGVSFISAVRTYADLSGLNGTASGVGEAFSPLIGIWAPTFSASELAAAFLLPFVAIRLFAGDRQSGALKIELQRPLPALARVVAKSLILAAAWAIASLPALIAVALWKSYGGSVYPPELLAVIGGHVLNAGLTIALASAASAVTEHPSTAAILTLSVTVGTWIVNFIAAVQGDWWERAAAYTPTSMVAEFQHGLVRLEVVIAALCLIVIGLSIAAIWTRIGVAVRQRFVESMAVAGLAVTALIAGSFATASADLSEARGNSFTRADERALRQIRAPLRMVVHLAPEDPRRGELERRALSKLRRVLPRAEVEYVAATTTGMFEQTREHYGEIWYDLGGRKLTSRATTADGVLESIYELADVPPPAQSEEDVFRGHPLATHPRYASALFYAAWPGTIVGAALFTQWRRQ
jgi:hypothetical protein